MACQSEFLPPPLTVGAFTGIEFRNLPAPSGDCAGFFIDGITLFASVIVPPFTEVDFQVKIGIHTFRVDVVTNNTAGSVFAGIAGAIAISDNGKQFQFNDSGGNPQVANVDGFWQDGVTVIVAADSIPTGSAPTTIEWSQFLIDTLMTLDSTFEGDTPPDAPTLLDGEVDPDTDDINLTWTTNSDDELGFKVERSIDGGETWEVRGFTTANITEFTDGDLVDGESYTYRVSAFRGDGTAPNSGTSEPTNEITISYTTPDIVMIGSGGIDLGGAAEIVYISDPSGIYTLVSGKTHDTLYERMTGITTQNVKIPDPFFITSYHGD